MLHYLESWLFTMVYFGAKLNFKTHGPTMQNGCYVSKKKKNHHILVSYLIMWLACTNYPHVSTYLPT